MGESQYQDVCLVDELHDEQPLCVVVGETAICVVRVGSEFFAVNDRCPHAGASLARGYVERFAVSCRIHHWKFCLRRGTCLEQDGSKPDVASYPIRVLGDMLQIKL